MRILSLTFPLDLGICQDAYHYFLKLKYCSPDLMQTFDFVHSIPLMNNG